MIVTRLYLEQYIQIKNQQGQLERLSVHLIARKFCLD